MNEQAMNIVLAVDGSEYSFAAAKTLCELPCAKNCTVTAIAVVSPKQSYKEVALLAALEKTRGELACGEIDVRTKLMHGHPAVTLLDYAKEHKSGLILLGAKGLRATLGILLGGVAQQVVEYAPCPVMVIRPAHTAMRRILLVTDGSISSQHAEKFIGNFAFPKDAKIEVACVLPPLPSPEQIARSWQVSVDSIESQSLHEIMANIQQNADEHAEEEKARLKNVIDALQTQNVQAASIILRGDAATEILEYTKANDVDLIVAGSRGLSQIRGWLLGSVSRKLVHYSDCSVLIAKGEEESV